MNSFKRAQNDFESASSRTSYNLSPFARLPTTDYLGQSTSRVCLTLLWT